LLFVVLFIFGGPVMQGATPTLSDDAGEVRAYWEQDHGRYLAGDLAISVAIIFGLVPFGVATARSLQPHDRSGGVWSAVMLAGVFVAVFLGGAGAMFLGGVALYGAENLDDSTLLFGTRAAIFSVNGVAFGFGLMLVGAATVIVQTKAFGRWLGFGAFAAAVPCVVGALWVFSENNENALGLAMFVGVQLGLVWIATISAWFLFSKAASNLTHPVVGAARVAEQAAR
jgi:hypothetical protein